MLVLLATVGSSLDAKFCGPYEVVQKLSDTNYVIRMLDRKKKSRVCHINMLKQYCARDNSAMPSVTSVPCVSPVVEVVSPSYSPREDGLREQPGSMCALREF